MFAFLQHPKKCIFLCIAYCFLAELRLCDASGTISRGGGRRTRVRGGTRYDGLLLLELCHCNAASCDYGQLLGTN